MVIVSKSNLFSAVRTNVVSLLSDSNNVSDPITSSSEFRLWIYDRFPDVKNSDFKGYPFLVVHQADVEIEKKGSVDGKSKRVGWDLEVDIYSSDLKGKGSSYMESISDDVFETFLSMTNRDTLSGFLLRFSVPVSSPVVVESISDELVFVRTITLGFSSKLQVSS